MPKAHDYYPDCPEALMVSLARQGDRKAFAELVQRRQSWIRNLMKRCCNDAILADDLSQQVFLKMWINIRSLKEPAAFAGWLKRLAINTWLQHLRKNDALRNADEVNEVDRSQHDSSSEGIDLDTALANLSAIVRLCIVLSYHEGLSHAEIAEVTELPLGTVKSHINRGTQKLQELLGAYQDDSKLEN